MLYAHLKRFRPLRKIDFKYMFLHTRNVPLLPVYVTIFYDRKNYASKITLKLKFKGKISLEKCWKIIHFNIIDYLA